MHTFKTIKELSSVICVLTVVSACSAGEPDKTTAPTRTSSAKATTLKKATADRQTELSKGLIGHWTFDDKDNPGRDSSGRDHHGILKGPVWGQDKGGSGVLLFAPLAYGAVHPWAYATAGLTLAFLSLILLIGVSLTSLFARDASLTLPRPPLWGVVLAASLLVLFQLIPLPAGVVSWLSPGPFRSGPWETVTAWAP